MQHVDSTLVRLDTVTQRMARALPVIDPRTRYSLNDLDRNSKTVGAFWTPLRISQGDRIFLGDDMWDVKMVKIFGSPADTVNGSTINSVELLVSYAGKAKDPKQSSAP